MVLLQSIRLLGDSSSDVRLVRLDVLIRNVIINETIAAEQVLARHGCHVGLAMQGISISSELFVPFTVGAAPFHY